MYQDVATIAPDATAAATDARDPVPVDQVLWLAQYLDLADRALVNQAVRRGVPVTAIAQAAGRNPQLLQRHLRRVLRRVLNPLFRFVVTQRIHWPEHRRTIVDAIVLRGLPQRTVARELGVTEHQIRKELARVTAIFERMREEA